MGAMNRPVPLLHVTRCGVLESVHHGSVVVVERGRTVVARGDVDQTVYYRSTSKPMQALVGITSGAADAFGFDEAELALAAGSHSTRPEHLETARRILEKAGVPEDLLGCGGHYAFDLETRTKQRSEGLEPVPLWSNCSGKHAMMLAVAKHWGLGLDDYLSPDHPVQREIRRHVALMCDVDEERVSTGVDGCSAPAFAVPLSGMALSLARLADPDGLPDDMADGLRRIGQAMEKYPEMVGGPGRFDTDLMSSSEAVLLAKAGAEGVHGVAAPPRGLGLAVKVTDGSDRGYRLVVLTMLRRLGLLTEDELQDIASRQCSPVVKTISKDPVGTLEVVLEDLA